jgi:hypothetical protein
MQEKSIHLVYKDKGIFLDVDVYDIIAFEDKQAAQEYVQNLQGANKYAWMMERPIPFVDKQSSQQLKQVG